MPSHAPLVSPRIARLHGEVAQRGTAALDQFWQEMAEQGTPLLEACPEDPDATLVTFLYQGGAELSNVVLFNGPVGLGVAAHNQLAHLPETDVWFRSYPMRSDARCVYQLAVDYPLADASFGRTAATLAAWRTKVGLDPLNHHPYPLGNPHHAPPDSPLAKPYFSLVELPNAPAQPYVTPQPGVPAGTLTTRPFTLPPLGLERPVWVYTPPGYDPAGAPAGLLVVLDGLAYTTLVPTPTILDNLVAAGLLPPLVAVFVDCPPLPNEAARPQELGCSEPFLAAVVDDVLGWVRAHYAVTGDPTRTIIAGSSLGGVFAAFAGLRRPEVFGKVLVQSGAFWWAPPGEEEPGWVIREYVAQERVPLRFWVEVGVLETGAVAASMPPFSRHFRDVLRAKGYPLQYREFNGNHTYACWRGSLADGLVALAGAEAQRVA